MNRCELANQYHEKGFNCAQSVLAAFGDLTHLPEREAMAVSGGFGGGIGGSHREVCGAMSGAVMVLGILYPHAEENSAESKRHLYAVTREFQRRFQDRFGCDRCGDLLQAKVQPDGAARELGISQHCAVLVVSAVEIVERMLREAGALQ